MPLTIPDELVRQYRDGSLRTTDIAAKLGVSTDRARRALRRQGATLPQGEARQAAFARRVERANGLEPGSLYEHVAALYRSGHGQITIAERLGIASREVVLILRRAGVETRPTFFRSAFFSGGTWRQVERAAFAEALRAAREDRSLSQAELGKRAGLSQRGVWSLEAGRNGPHWSTALKLAEALGVTPAELGLPELPPEELRRLARARTTARRKPEGRG
jgi:DNA-binding XRE family transcriptional regulator/transposase-like protein